MALTPCPARQMSVQAKIWLTTIYAQLGTFLPKTIVVGPLAHLW